MRQRRMRTAAQFSLAQFGSDRIGLVRISSTQFGLYKAVAETENLRGFLFDILKIKVFDMLSKLQLPETY